MQKNNTLSLALLGSFAASVGGEVILDGGYAKLRGLLAMLAMSTDTPLRREFLAELFWPDMPIATARQNLRLALFNLKSSMAEAGCLLSTSRDMVTLSSGELSLDVAEFVADMPAGIPQMEQQAALYRGEFMAGFYLPGCPELDDWLQLQRESLQRRALALLERLANVYEQAGDYQNALQHALRYLELDSWDEHAHRRVMRLYALSGSDSAALAQFDTCCKLLKSEMGALPSEETRQLAERIRSGALERQIPPASPLPTAAPTQPERLQVTVLYCELSAVEIDDPDDALALLRTPQARCMTIIQQFSGHIVQTHGGGLLAYFGYPQADEYAARHAVQAALAVTREASCDIKIRAGVHTGLIITGIDTAMPDTLGKTSRLAIQLRLHATNNEVVISRQTQNIIDGYFDCFSLGVQPVPDSQAIEVFRVTRESGARTRLDATAQLTPFVGRRAVLARLQTLWKSTTRGSRNVALLQGVAGEGKSRLLHALKEQLQNQSHAIRELRCFAEFSQSPFQSLIELLEALFGFASNDSPERRLGKLVSFYEMHYPAFAREAVPLFAQQLALPPPDQYPPLGLSPQQHKERTIAILRELLHTLAVRQPVLLIVEDMHWIDPSTLELLTQFITQQEKGAIFLLMTSRPEFIPPWDASLSTTLAIDPLTADESAQMVAAINDRIPADIRSQIVQRADGVPLFIEEISRLAGTADMASIPATLHDLLAMRMSKLDEAKFSAQLAATIGREFDLNLLGKVYTRTPEALAHSLSVLQDEGIVLKVNKATLQFKHALIQEAAYQSQTKANRQTAHGRIAQALLSDFPEIAANQPEVLAQHFSCAGETQKSIEYRLRAGQRAAMNSALAEAISHYNSGLQLIVTQPHNEERDRLETELRYRLGTALVAFEGSGSAKADQAYDRAMQLSEKLDETPNQFQVLWGRFMTSSSRADYSHSLDIPEELLRMAEKSDNVLQLQQAHYAMGDRLFSMGCLEQSSIHLKQSIARYQPSQHERMASEAGINICVVSNTLLMLVLWLQGYSKRADEISQQNMALARQINHPLSLGFALSGSAIMFNRWLKQPDAVMLLAQECMDIANKYNMPLWLGMGATSYGWAMAMQGQAAGAAQIQQSLNEVNVIMSGARLMFLAPLCEALFELGQYDEALQKLDDALGIAEEMNERLFESELFRLKGECILKISPKKIEEAECCFDRALAISRKQGAKSLELRAAMSLARLWQQQGKQEDARSLLEDVYNWFGEGFDTHDLQDASSLLGALDRLPVRIMSISDR